MSDIARLLDGNKVHASTSDLVRASIPARRLAVLTCMDTRIDALGALGLELGEAVVLRNAGARVTDDVLRSLAVAVHKLGVDTVVVMQHTDCGASGTTDEELRSLTGAHLAFLPIDDHADALRSDIDLLAETSYLGQVQAMAGLVYDVVTGEVQDVVRWNRSPGP
jgi:carbonic anhydrase